eukprot:CAMPEP_0197024970 /NCGR_PEP_ID=MMETSP1384-20130603/5432_1 /TAXON_ID=29189 /ORGANISM="Ammonia sp." /LENGTH=219 /DNA_ID=CAMNT_0042453443 /DNA_START=23 /DNA_END=682 /DNA_ORIENTATION=+
MAAPTWTMNIQRSCAVLYFHFFFGISLILLGWTTFAARWIPRIKPYHRRLGQIWVYGMIVQVYTSTYVSYNGFRWFIFMFGVICYGSLITGHSFIRKFQLKIREQRSNAMTRPLKYVGVPTKESDGDAYTAKTARNDDSLIEQITDNENRSLQSESQRTWFTQKRLKQIHGIFMFLSLVMLTGAGAAFTTRFSQTKECKNIYCDADADGNVPECMVHPS